MNEAGDAVVVFLPDVEIRGRVECIGRQMDAPQQIAVLVVGRLRDPLSHLGEERL